MFGLGEIKKEETIQKNKTALYACMIFGLCAHAFAFLNLIYNHDSVIVIKNDDNWQISIGRWFQIFYTKLRGVVSAPWLIGILSLIFIAISLLFIIDLFALSDRGYIVVFAGICATNISTICANASFLYMSDIFMFTLLLAVASVWLTYRYQWGFLFAAVLLALDMSIYQSYLATYIVLVMIITIWKILENKPIKEILISVLKAIGAVAMASIIYFIGFQISLAVTGVEAAKNKKNSLANLNDFFSRDFIALFKTTYSYFVHSFLRNKVSIFANGILAGISVVMLCSVCKRKKEISHILLLAAIFIVFPLGANCICFMSNGYVQELMIYSFWFVYLLPILIFETYKKGLSKKEFDAGKIIKIFRGLIIGCIFIIVANNIVLANQLYTKKKLVYDSTQTIVTRMLCRMEMTEGYIEGETPVYIVGDFGKNPAFKNSYREFDQANDIRGARYVSAITYNDTRGRFFKYIMGTKVKLLHQDSTGELRAKAREMPSYPAQGFCQMYRGVLIVRISEK